MESPRVLMEVPNQSLLEAICEFTMKVYSEAKVDD